MQANRTVQGMVCHVCERGCLHADQYVLEEVANQPAKNNNHCRLAGFAYERRDDCDCAVPQGVHVAHPASCLALLSPATPPTVPLSLALLPAAAPPHPLLSPRSNRRCKRARATLHCNPSHRSSTIRRPCRCSCTHWPGCSSTP